MTLFRDHEMDCGDLMTVVEVCDIAPATSLQDSSRKILNPILVGILPLKEEVSRCILPSFFCAKKTKLEVGITAWYGAKLIPPACFLCRWHWKKCPTDPKIRIERFKRS